jgi:hypothetical protein
MRKCAKKTQNAQKKDFNWFELFAFLLLRILCSLDVCLNEMSSALMAMRKPDENSESA